MSVSNDVVNQRLKEVNDIVEGRTRATLDTYLAAKAEETGTNLKNETRNQVYLLVTGTLAVMVSLAGNELAVQMLNKVAPKRRIAVQALYFVGIFVATIVVAVLLKLNFQ